MCSSIVKYAVLDVDGVVVKYRSSWQYIHEILGCKDIADMHREAAFRKLINYKDWAFIDTFLWRGYSRDSIKMKFDDLIPGVLDLLKILKKYRVWIVMVSGGLELAYELVRDYVDLYISNSIVYRDGKVYSISVRVCSKDCIAKILENIINIDWSRTIAIGDSRIDIPILARARYSIAFNPLDDEVGKVAKFVVYSLDMYPVVNIVKAILDKTL